ncbi:MAG: TfoX/Sxy family protein [Pseudomonadota bacterium]
MAVTDEDIAFIRDVFSALPDLSHRKMMGGLSLYSETRIFAIMGADGRVYVKAVGPLAQDLEEAGSEIFKMTRKDGSVASMGYWTLPESALDDPEEAAMWGRRALAENT